MTDAVMLQHSTRHDGKQYRPGDFFVPATDKQRNELLDTEAARELTEAEVRAYALTQEDAAAPKGGKRGPKPKAEKAPEPNDNADEGAGDDDGSTDSNDSEDDGAKASESDDLM